MARTPGALSLEEKRKAQDIVGVFETGKAGGGDPSTVTILPDGAGITYGKHQATDHRNTLDSIVLEYIGQGGVHAECLRGYLPYLARNSSVSEDPRHPSEEARGLMAVLAEAGKDIAMRRAQDAVFDRLYWDPMVALAKSLRLVEPLTYAVLYDTTVHSGLGGIDTIRVRFREVPPSRGGEEHAWTRAYVEARRAWLAGFVGKSPAHTGAVRATVYRMDTFRELLRNENWGLNKPIRILSVDV